MVGTRAVLSTRNTDLRVVGAQRKNSSFVFKLEYRYSRIKMNKNVLLAMFIYMLVMSSRTRENVKKFRFV